VSRSEIAELKEIEKQEAKNSKDGEQQRVINPETLFYTLK
jgi:hypothetical protein